MFSDVDAVPLLQLNQQEDSRGGEAQQLLEQMRAGRPPDELLLGEGGARGRRRSNMSRQDQSEKQGFL